MNINASLKTIQLAAQVTRFIGAAVMLVLLFKLGSYVLQVDAYKLEHLMLALGMLAGFIELARAFVNNTRAF